MEVIGNQLDSTSYYSVGQYKYSDGLSNSLVRRGLYRFVQKPILRWNMSVGKNCPGFLQHIYQSWQPPRCSNRLSGRKGQHHREKFSGSAVIVLMPEPSHAKDLLDLFETVGLIPSAIRRIEPVPMNRPAFPSLARQRIAGEDAQHPVSHPRNTSTTGLPVLNRERRHIEQFSSLFASEAREAPQITEIPRRDVTATKVVRTSHETPPN